MAGNIRGTADRTAVAVAAVAVIALAGCGLTTPHDPEATPTTPHRSSTATTRRPLPTPATPPESKASLLQRGCHLDDPRAGVNSPTRLIVKDPCVTVHGIVGCIFTDEEDGDTHLALLPDPDDAHYLTRGNLAWACADDQGSDDAPRMVVEVIPQHCTARPDNCADRGHFTDPAIPPHGSHVAITGAWVLDTSTRSGMTLWSEIHPAFRIVVDQ